MRFYQKEYRERRGTTFIMDKKDLFNKIDNCKKHFLLRRYGHENYIRNYETANIGSIKG